MAALRPKLTPSRHFASFTLLLALAGVVLFSGEVDATCSGCSRGGDILFAKPVPHPAVSRWGRSVYPIIQFCGGPASPSTGAVPAKGEGGGETHAGPDCVFSGLRLDVETHPQPLARIRTVEINGSYPVGTYISPWPIPFPSIDCPLRFQVHLPPLQVPCGGPATFFHGVWLRTIFEQCNGQFSYASQNLQMGYVLKCAKSGQEPLFLGNGKTWFKIPFTGPETTRVVFAIANADPTQPHDINTLLQPTQPWTILTPPPSQITLGPLASTTVSVDLVVPQGTPQGTQAQITLSGYFDDAPSPVNSATVDLEAGTDPDTGPAEVVPINSLGHGPVPGATPALIALAAIALAAAGWAALRGRREKTA